MTLELWHGETSSAVNLNNRRIEYTDRTHRYRAKSDYSLLVSEYQTYGPRAAEQLFDYLEATRKNKTT